MTISSTKNPPKSYKSDIKIIISLPKTSILTLLLRGFAVKYHLKFFYSVLKCRALPISF